MNKDKQYRIINGTSYDERTPMEVIGVLESARMNNIRIKLHYGDTKTGKDWEEMHETTGKVGRSTGSIKIPLLLYNRNSTGGGAILDYCIVKITTTRKPKTILYQHPLYKENN